MQLNDCPAFRPSLADSEKNEETQPPHVSAKTVSNWLIERWFDERGRETFLFCVCVLLVLEMK